MSKKETSSTTTTNGTTAPTLAPPDPSAPTVNSLRDALAKDTVPRRRVWMPHWGMWVNLRGMSSDDRDDWAAAHTTEDAEGNQKVINKGLRVHAISLCLVNDDDELMAVGEVGRDALGKAPPRTIDFLWNEVAQLNTLRQQDHDELKNGSGGGHGSVPSPESQTNTG